MFDFLNHIVKRKKNHLLFLAAIVTLFFSATIYAKDSYISVTPEDLLKFPQKYWSQAIIFEDKMEKAPQTQLISLGKKKYYPFSLVELGHCYADREIVDDLRISSLSDEYVFQGTVLHKPKSFFSRSPTFFIVVQRFSKKFDAVEKGQENLLNTQKNQSSLVNDVISRVQQDLIAYAQANDIGLSDLFAEDFKDSQTVRRLINSGIAELEQQNNTTARALLRDFIAEIFTAEYGSMNASYTPRIVEEVYTTPDINLVDITEEPETDFPVAEIKPATQSNEEANLQALKKRAIIMLKPGIRPKP